MASSSELIGLMSVPYASFMWHSDMCGIFKCDFAKHFYVLFDVFVWCCRKPVYVHIDKYILKFQAIHVHIIPNIYPEPLLVSVITQKFKIHPNYIQESYTFGIETCRHSIVNLRLIFNKTTSYYNSWLCVRSKYICKPLSNSPSDIINVPVNSSPFLQIER